MARLNISQITTPLELFILCLSTCLIIWVLGFNSTSLTFVVECHFFLYIILIVLDYYSSHRITLFQTWVGSYVFIIWSDMMILSQNASFLIYKDSIAFLLMANNIFLLGYLLSTPKNKKIKIENRIIKNVKRIPLMLTIALVIYVVVMYKIVIASFTEGRQTLELSSTQYLLNVLVTTLGLIIPVFSAFYFKFYSKHTCYSLFFVLPVFAIQAVLGTRFKLLYMIIPYCIILNILDVRSLSKRKLLILGGLMVILVSVTNFIKEYRNMSIADALNISTLNDNNTRNDNLLLKLAEKMSPEGIVRMTYLANDYFSKHELEYGKEIGQLIYFIIPRSLWNNKPTAIDYWLIRKYEVVPESHSTASGFPGEIRADFGMFCFIILFFWGKILKFLDDYSKRIYNQNGPYYDKILVAMIYPYIFFFVRSPLTASNSFIFELLLYYIIKKSSTLRVSHDIKQADTSLHSYDVRKRRIGWNKGKD